MKQKSIIAAVFCLLVTVLSGLLPAQQLYFDNGKKYYAEKNYYAAIELLEKYVVKNINHLEAHELLVESYLRGDRTEEGQAYYKKLLLNNPGNKTLPERLAEKCYRMGVDLTKANQYRQAIAGFKMATVFIPQYKDVAAWIKTCNDQLLSLEREGNRQEQAKASYAAGLQAVKENSFITAATNFQKATQYDPRYKQMVEDWVPVADNEAKKGNKQKAMNYYKLCLALDMDNMPVHEGLIRLLRRDGAMQYQWFYMDLIKMYPQSTALKDTLPGKFFQEGLLLKQNGDFKLALSKFKDASFFNAAYKGLPEEIRSCGNSIDSVETFLKNRKLADKNYEKGVTCFKQKKTDLAIAEFRQAALLDPRMKTRAGEWKANGLAGLKEKNKEMALRCFQVAHVLDPGAHDIHLSLLQAYIDLDDSKELEQHCRDFKSQFPENSAANREVADLMYQKGSDDKRAQKYQPARIEFKIVAWLQDRYKDNQENITFCETEIKRLATIAANKKNAQASYEQGVTLYNQAQYPGALGKFTEAVKLDESLRAKAEQWYEKGVKAAGSKAYLKAINSFQIGMIFNIEDPKIHQQLVEVWITQKNGSGAVLDFYADLREKNPNNTMLAKQLPDYFFKTGQKYLKDQAYEKAEVFFRLAKKLDKSIMEADQNIAFCGQQVELRANLKQARSYYDKAIQEVAAGHFDKAVPAFKKAGELDPSYRDYPSILRKEGLDDLKKKKFNSAAKKLELVLMTNIADVQLHTELINAGIENNNIDYLIDLYRDLTVEFPFEPTIRKVLPENYYDQAIRHKNSKKYETAYLEFRVVQMLKPQYQDVEAQMDELRRK